MARGDLTTLANVKAWLSIPDTNTASDVVLSRLITAASAQIRTYTSRYNFLPATTTEVRDGTDTNTFVCKNWPVLSVSVVQVDKILVPQAPLSLSVTSENFGGMSSGWYLKPYDGNPPGEPQSVELYGFRFYAGTQNCRVTYEYGYQEVEAAVAALTYTVEAPQGSWASDSGVTYATTGAPLSPVSGSPAAGQYSVAAGVYTFAEADMGTLVVITYGFVPADLEQACIDLTVYRQQMASRIGIKSKSLGGQETVAFDISGIPDIVAAALAPYVSVLQVP
jgi:hypothetical protein